MKKRTRLLGLLLMAAAAALGQHSGVPLGARLKLRWQGDTVRFQEGSTAHEISIRKQFEAVRLETVILQSAKEANGFIYLLLDATGPSKLPRV
jgi:hypothetical protein